MKNKILKNDLDIDENWTKSIGALGFEATHDVYCERLKKKTKQRRMKSK